MRRAQETIRQHDNALWLRCHDVLSKRPWTVRGALGESLMFKRQLDHMEHIKLARVAEEDAKVSLRLKTFQNYQALFLKLFLIFVLANVSAALSE